MKLKLDIRNNRQILYVIGFLVLLIVFNLVYKSIQSKKDESFMVLTEIQDLATNQQSAILNSTNQVLFKNSSVGNNFSGSPTGNSLTDILNDIYSKINENNTTVRAALNTANTAVTTANSISTILPIGTIIAWNQAELPDATWRLCDGAVYQYVDGQRAPTIRTPDLRGRFVLGSGKCIDTVTNTLGKTYLNNNMGGEDQHRLTSTEMPAHTHWIYNLPIGVDFSNSVLVKYPNKNGLFTAGDGRFSNTNWNLFKVPTEATGGDASLGKMPSYNPNTDNNVMNQAYNNVELNQTKPHNIMPPYYVLTYIIKVFRTTDQATNATITPAPSPTATTA